MIFRTFAAALALTAATAPAAAQDRVIGTALNVADLDQAVRFYTQGLGMKVATTIDLGLRSETILTFGDDPERSAILLMHDKNPAAAKPLVQGNAFSRLVIGTSDLAALAVRLTALGYAHGPIRDASHGTRILIVTDPAGFSLELVQRKAEPK